MHGDELKVPSQRADERHDEQAHTDVTGDTTTNDHTRDDHTDADDPTRDGHTDADDYTRDDRTDTDDPTRDDRTDADDPTRDDRTDADDYVRDGQTDTGTYVRDGHTNDDTPYGETQRTDTTLDDSEDAPYRDPYAKTDDVLVEPETVPETGPDAGIEGVTQTGPANTDETPAHAAPKEIVLFDQDPTAVQARWRDLQAAFVDDPSEAVQRADGLVEEVVEALTSALTTRTGELREKWKGADGGDTEQLRLALREYRGVLERLLALSGTGTR